MANKQINKIIYFDRETIRNILQERDKGQVEKKTDYAATLQGQGSLGVEITSKVQLDVPFFARLSFLFTGKIEAGFLSKIDRVTTISSTEISEFEKLKPSLECIKDRILCDIENSSTFFRVAGGYLRIIKGGVDGVDTKEFKAVMDSFEGYDTYKIDDERYVRFNNSAFVSNYKRNDLLTTKMTLYCISVGRFDKDRFDFTKEITKMQGLISTTEGKQSLADVYPPSADYSIDGKQIAKQDNKPKYVELFDALYACISTGEKK